MLNKAIEIAKNSLENIKDENGNPYIDHAYRIMDKMDTEEEKIVAILHDVPEDAHVPIYELQKLGFSRNVIEALDQLTKRKNMTYFEYIEDIASSELASKVKIAELEDNKDIFRVNQLSFKTYTLDERAKKAIGLLRHTDTTYHE